MSSVTRALRPSVLLLAVAVLAACDKVPLTAPTNTTIRLTARTNVLPTNGSTDITAVVIESAGTAVQNGTVITFSSSLGNIEPREARTTNGQVTVRYLAGSQSGPAKISAFSGGAKSDDLEILVGSAAAGGITVRASQNTVPTTGGTVDIIATVLDTGGNPLRGASVRFSADAGSLSQSTALSNEAGEARTQLTTDRTAKVTADVGTGTTAHTASFTVQARVLPVVGVKVSGGEIFQPTLFEITPPTGEANAIREAVIDYGDGSAPRNLGALTATVTVIHTYTRTGNYTVTVRATDSQNVTGTATLALDVVERSTVPITLSATVSSGFVANFTAAGQPLGGQGSIRVYEWDFGDGRDTTTTGNTTAHRYSAAGTFTARVRVVTTTGHEGFAQTIVRTVP